MAKKVTTGEVKHTVAAAIGAAFGFIIALIWRDIIVGLFSMAGLVIDQLGEDAKAMDGVIAIVTGIIITLVCVIGIIYISRWGGKEE